MKRLICFVFLAGLITATSLSASPLASPAAYAAQNKTSLAEQKALMLRLNEIREMAKGRLSNDQKKKLRDEVIVARQRLNEPAGGIYISAGALIVIIILLIILL